MRIAALFLIALSYSGCGMLLGVKEIKSGDTTIKFATGFDLGANATSTDTADLKRSIRP